MKKQHLGILHIKKWLNQIHGASGMAEGHHQQKSVPMHTYVMLLSRGAILLFLSNFTHVLLPCYVVTIPIS